MNLTKVLAAAAKRRLEGSSLLETGQAPEVPLSPGLASPARDCGRYRTFRAVTHLFVVGLVLRNNEFG